MRTSMGRASFIRAQATQLAAADLPGESPRSEAPTRFDRRLRVVENTAFEALCIVDDGRRYLRANPAAARLLGAPVERIVGRRVDDFTLPEHLPLLEQLWEQLRAEGTLAGPYLCRQEDGSVQPMRFRAEWHYAPGEHLIAGLETAEAPPAATEPHKLTSREVEILTLAADGCSNQEIARQLVLSPATVKTHLQNAYRKLSVPDRAAAVAYALRSGLFR